jgi:hypothetical protein
MPESDNWGNAVEVVGPPEPLEPRSCDGNNCLDTFTPTWHKQRRCPRCRREKRPYKDLKNNPF